MGDRPSWFPPFFSFPIVCIKLAYFLCYGSKLNGEFKATATQASAPVGRFALGEKKQFLRISRRFCGGFSDETNQGDGEMASIGRLMLRDLRFDSFQ